jgi:Glycosyltransferase family 9 (heptosyltransferase)
MGAGPESAIAAQKKNFAISAPLGEMRRRGPPFHRASGLNSSTDAMPAFDTHCPMLSLPLAFGTQLETMPAKLPYLPRPAEDRVRAWHDRLPNALSRILDVDATFVSLQKDLRPGEKSMLEQSNVVDPTAGLTDFAETAALLSCLDLVISADTSVVHLAGALGRPAWLLLP